MFTTRLQTVYSPQTPLGELRTAELLVVSSLRLWVLSHGGHARDQPDWREGFRCARIGSAAAMGFDTVCHIVAAAALRNLDIRPLYCAHLGMDEGRFLCLLALLQCDRACDAESILSDWCPPAAVRLAVMPAHAFATGLSACRLRLASPHPEPATPHSLTFTAPALEGPRIH